MRMFLIKKNDLIIYFVLFFYIVLSGLMLAFSNSVIYDIAAFIFLVIGAVSLVKFDLAHPYVWFSIIFMLYSISYPILYLNGILYDVYTYTKSLMFSQWLALVVFLIIVGPFKTDFTKLKPKYPIMSSRIFLFFVSIILFITIYEVSSGGFSHKREIYSEGSIVIFIGFRAVLVFLILYAINLSIYTLEKHKIDVKLTLFVFSVTFLIVFFSGERDLIIRFFVIFLFIYYIIVKNSKLTKGIIGLGLIALTSIPVLAHYKYYGLTGVKSSKQLSFFLEFLSSEFQSASKNMQIILLDEGTKGMFYGSTFIESFLRSFNLDRLFGINVIPPGRWYNETFFEEGRSGQGFTLVGEGYLNFGYVGIVILFIFIGILVRFLYSISNKGIYSFSYYILSIPIFMYAIRADLANIISPLITQNLLVIVILKIFMGFYLRHIKLKGRSLYSNQVIEEVKN